MSQYGACTHCGSNLTPQDFQQPACRYCGTAFLHHQEAAAKVAELHAVMGMMRPPMAPGAAPVPGQLVVVPGMAAPAPGAAWAGAGVQGGASPPFGASPPPGGPVPAGPPQGLHALHVPAAPAAGKVAMLIIGLALGGAALLFIGGVLVAFLLRG